MHFGVYRNKKNGNKYVAFKTSKNSTNAQNGQIMMHYMNANGEEFVREIYEFFEKFEPITTLE